MRVIHILEHDDPEDFLIVEDSQIEIGNYCERYDEYGNQIGCYNAGCYSPDNDASDYKDGEEEYHTQCAYIDYWDGHNWQSFILEIENVEQDMCNGELLDKNDTIAIQILKEYNNAKWPIEYKSGEKKVYTQNYEFRKSLYAGHFEVAEVAVMSDKW